MSGRKTSHAVLIATVLLLSGRAQAQSCTDFDECTANDMCSNGECTGSFQTGGSCDDLDDCTTNDRCQIDDVEGEICRGEPKRDAPCQGGCGTCLPIGGEPGAPLTCGGNPDTAGTPCDPGFGPCVEGTCQFFLGGVVTCLPEEKTCPDTDGNPCTDGCDFETGQCVPNVPKCLPTCETCNTSTGACEPVNEGGACDDSNVCTDDSRCEATDIGGGVVRGFGLPGQSTPGGCVGDCDGNHVVVINELITGVNIALETFPVSQCPAFDTNDSDAVEVNELIGGVSASLNGCA